MNYENLLTEIAENEQKVYDAGYEAGRAEGGDIDTSDFITRADLDEVPTYESENPVTSHGVYNALYSLESKVDEHIENASSDYSTKEELEYAKTECNEYTDGKIAEVGAEEWRLIQKFTLEKDTVVVIDTDQQGQSFSLKKVKIVIEMPSGISSQIWLKHNSLLAVYTNNVNGQITGLIEGEYNKAYDDWFYETAVATSNSVPVAAYKFPRGHRFIGGTVDRKDKLDVNLTSISLAKTNKFAETDGFPTETKITVLGVDA